MGFLLDFLPRMAGIWYGRVWEVVEIEVIVAWELVLLSTKGNS
jgi:hypothetical protein